ncbi:MAG: NAD(P)/FAD-dependent oxidoreductase [Acidobacteriota bacterium]
MKDHHVVIIGGGFGGLCAARAFRRGTRVTVIDRRNHHLFQPLLYQVATGGLSPANIATPLRALLKRRAATYVRLGEVTGVDLDRRRVQLGDSELEYDSLIVAAGAGQSYFGHTEWEDMAPGLKTLGDATRIRRNVLLAFERAELETDEVRVRALLTFAVVGAGPTGVELAGALAEISRRTLAGEFRHIDPAMSTILLIEGADRVLPSFPEALSTKARRSLEELGVTVRTGWLVETMESSQIVLKKVQPSGDDERQTVACESVLWAAGIEASPLGKMLAESSSAGVDRIGRVIVEPDCSLAGRPEVFVIGDLAHYSHQQEQPLPGLAAVAMQQGRYVARVIERRLQGATAPPPFRYLDKGNMATIGRKKAVAEIAGLRFAGLFAWLAWLFVHLMYLAEFQNRVLVLVQWGWNYFTRNRSARLITELPDDP